MELEFALAVPGEHGLAVSSPVQLGNGVREQEERDSGKNRGHEGQWKGGRGKEVGADELIARLAGDAFCAGIELPGGAVEGVSDLDEESKQEYRQQKLSRRP
jgi:hypothetical protein